MYLNSVLRSQKLVYFYLESKMLLPFGFALQIDYKSFFNNFVVCMYNAIHILCYVLQAPDIAFNIS